MRDYSEIVIIILLTRSVLGYGLGGFLGLAVDIVVQFLDLLLVFLGLGGFSGVFFLDLLDGFGNLVLQGSDSVADITAVGLDLSKNSIHLISNNNNTRHIEDADLKFVVIEMSIHINAHILPPC